jgi:CRP/FNR family transcriptional regulator, cyclic AMP receptor protein
MTDAPEMTIEALRTVPLFASLDDGSASALRRLLKRRALKRGDVLFHQGDAGNAMFLIERGRVSIYITDDEGKEVTLAELAQGDFFGEMALIEGKPRTAGARAAEETSLASLSRDDFIAFVRLNADVALAMLGALSDRLRATDELLRRRVSRNANEVEDARLTLSDRAADVIAEFGGSWKFIGAAIGFLLLWVLFNSWVLRQGFDPFPYVLLNLVLGMITGLQAPIIMMSQNRQGSKDRIRADLDYQVNLKNELSLTEVLRRLDVLESERLPALFAEQNARLRGDTRSAAPNGDAGS